MCVLGEPGESEGTGALGAWQKGSVKVRNGLEERSGVNSNDMIGTSFGS